MNADEPARCACGRKAEVLDWSLPDDPFWTVQCRNAKCWQGPVRRTRAGAVAAWNRVMGPRR